MKMTVRGKLNSKNESCPSLKAFLPSSVKLIYVIEEKPFHLTQFQQENHLKLFEDWKLSLIEFQVLQLISELGFMKTISLHRSANPQMSITKVLIQNNALMRLNLKLVKVK